MTSQREAKKQQKATATGTALVVAREPWEDKLRRAILTGRRGIIEAQLTAWAAFDTAMQAEYGRRREFSFDPAEVARAARIRLQMEQPWPLYQGRR